MKATKPDGSRWFRPTASEIMDHWLEQPDLQSWLTRTVEFRQGDRVGEVLGVLPDAVATMLLDELLLHVAAKASEPVAPSKARARLARASTRLADLKQRIVQPLNREQRRAAQSRFRMRR